MTSSFTSVSAPILSLSFDVPILLAFAGLAAIAAGVACKVSMPWRPGYRRGIRTALSIDIRRDPELPVSTRPMVEEHARLAHKAETCGHLASGLAHDFNNLLFIIVANLDRASRVLAPHDAALRFVTDAMAASDRAAALVGKLMNVTRHAPSDPSHVDLDCLIRGLEPMIAGLLRGHVVVFDLASGGLVHIDASDFETVLLNLAVNARDAMPEGGTLTVRTKTIARTNAGDDLIEVSIEDTGTGMTPDVMARACDPFFTTKPMGNGTGLGLSLVDGFMRTIGGRLHLASESGRGSRVTLSLPRAIPASVHARTVPPTSEANGHLAACTPFGPLA